MSNPRWQGIFPAVTTKFHADESIDAEGTARHIDFQIRNGIHGIVTCGSLGEFSTVGNMMGGLAKGDLFIEGRFAKLMYTSLYKMHELALHGWVKVALDTLARMITRRTEPHVKLH